jgi:hypothetical protein
MYLAALPFTITIPHLKTVVVHAGFVEGTAIAEQNPLDMVSIRNVMERKNGGFKASAKTRRGKAWAEVWDGPEHVFFGHDAARRLQLKPFATGLDTGCVYGGFLSAAILEPTGEVQIVQVAAAEDYSGPLCCYTRVTLVLHCRHTVVPLLSLHAILALCSHKYSHHSTVLGRGHVVEGTDATAVSIGEVPAQGKAAIVHRMLIPKRVGLRCSIM